MADKTRKKKYNLTLNIVTDASQIEVGKPAPAGAIGKAKLILSSDDVDVLDSDVRRALLQAALDHKENEAV